MAFLIFALDRGTFFGLLLAGLVGLVVAYFLFMVIRAFVIVFLDIKTGRELNRLAVEFSEKRKEAAELAAARLDTGCQHVFDDRGGALPQDVCCKCGLAKTQPAGECDHVWRVIPGIIPRSQCERCHAEFTAVHEADGRSV